MLEICINNTGILTPINSVLRGPYNYMVKYTASSDVKSLHVGSVNAKGTSKMWSRQRKIKRHKWSWGFLRILRLRQENSDLPGFLNDQRNYETKITTVASKICLAIRSSSHLQRSTQSRRCRYQHFCEFFCTQNMEKNADEIFLWNMIISYIILYHIISYYIIIPVLCRFPDANSRCRAEPPHLLFFALSLFFAGTFPFFSCFSCLKHLWSSSTGLGFRIMADVGQIFQRRVGGKSCDHHDSEDEGHDGDNGEDKNDEGRQRQQSRTTECCNRQETQSQNPGG